METVYQQLFSNAFTNKKEQKVPLIRYFHSFYIAKQLCSLYMKRQQWQLAYAQQMGPQPHL
jgi:hypothetical protein